MNYVVNEHARGRMNERGITEAELDGVMQGPQQVIEQPNGRMAFQSLIVRSGRIVMIRAFVDTRIDPAEVKSVYVTTNPRYWSAEDDAN